MVNTRVVNVLVLLQLQEVDGTIVVAEILVLGPGVIVMNTNVVAVAVEHYQEGLMDKFRE